MRAHWIVGVVLVTLLLGGLGAAVALHLVPVPTLADVRMHEAAVKTYAARHPVLLAAIYAFAVVVFTALPLPGAEVMTVAAGALFGLAEGTVLILLTATTGACGAFLLGRCWLGDLVTRSENLRFGWIVAGFEREGAFYLFALRMIPVVPFFIVNVLMGATSIRLLTFAWVSGLAMLPGIIVYANAGRALMRITSVAQILSPGLLASFALVGIMPLAARYAVLGWRRHRGRCGG